MITKKKKKNKNKKKKDVTGIYSNTEHLYGALY